jgi:hypothetical protein
MIWGDNFSQKMFRFFAASYSVEAVVKKPLDKMIHVKYG